MMESTTPNDGYAVETQNTSDGLEVVVGRKYADEWQTKAVVAKRNSDDLVATGEIFREFMLCQTVTAYLNAGGTAEELRELIFNIIPVIDSHNSMDGYVLKDFGYTEKGDIALDFFNTDTKDVTRWVYGDYIDEHISYADLMNEIKEH